MTWLKKQVKENKIQAISISIAVTLALICIGIGVIYNTRDTGVIENGELIADTQGMEEITGEEVEESDYPESTEVPMEQESALPMETLIPTTTSTTTPITTPTVGGNIKNPVTTPIHEEETVVKGEQGVTQTPEQPSNNTGTSTLPTTVPTVPPTPEPTSSPIGSVTLSMDAEVIGLGTLLRNVEVKIYEGEPASYAVTRGLKEHGFTYVNTGSLDKKFYLAAIKKTGLIQNPTIPNHVKNILEENEVEVNLTEYRPNQLGEFDFTRYSGWRYSVNGSYAGVGMSEYTIKPGDRIHLRYTLCLGYDS